MAGRQLVLGLLLVASMMLAGCNVADWYNQEGTVRVELQMIGPEESDIENFESLSLAVRSVQIRQQDAANPLTATKNPPEIIDMAQLAESGQRVRLLEEKVNLRGFNSITLKIEAIEGISAANERIPGCEQGTRVEEPPCVRFARQGTYPLRMEPTDFAVPRGGVLTVVIPVGVQYDGATNEYFVFTQPARKA